MFLARTGVTHFFAGQRELGEVLFEALGQVSYLPVVCFLVGPGIARNEQRIRHIRARGRNVQSEGGIRHYLYILQRSTDSSTHHCPCVVDVDTLANAIGSAGPACVDEIAAHVMLLNALSQQVRIFSRLKWEEGRAKAGAEGRLRRCYARFSTRQLTGVAREEVIHSLLRRQLRDWRQDAERVCREEEDRPRLTCSTGLDDIVDEVDGVGLARILRQRLVGITCAS